MTQPTPDFPESPESRRQNAEALNALYDKLGKLRTMLCMLHASGFEHFRRMEEPRQEEYLGVCMELADGAYAAMLKADGFIG
jgi:hypothetical protein